MSFARSFFLFIVGVYLALSKVEAGGYGGRAARDRHISKPTFSLINLQATHKVVELDKQEENSIPKDFNWCEEDESHGALCTPSWNQHIPTYCGSCYLHASLSTIQDRIYIKQKGKLPPVSLARQSFLQCAPFMNISNGCGGGEASEVFSFMKIRGLPDESCQVYKAQDNSQYGPNAKECPATGFCENCMPDSKTGEPVCWPIKRPILYRVKEFGQVQPRLSEMHMRYEVYKNGPIVCGIAAYNEFDYGYRGGVWHKGQEESEVDHDVEIVGWGENEIDGPYWIIRNSWGSYWGELGFFKIPRGVNHMQIESDCWWAEPEYNDIKAVQKGRLQGSMYGLIKNTKQKDDFFVDSDAVGENSVRFRP